MSVYKPTNQDLAKIVHDGFDAVGRRFNKLEKRVEKVHDYMIGQQAIDENSKASSSKHFDDRAWEVIKWLVLIIGAIIGVKLV